MPSGGRNGPCPCGSGRARKHCCGNGDHPRVDRGASATREGALSKLLTFAFHPAFDSDHAVAETIFWGDVISDASSPEFQWLLDSEDATIKYNSWFLFDWESESGTVVELFLEEAEGKLSRAERDFLERLSMAHLRLYEVQSVEPGEGAHLIDLWTGARLFVTEKAATTQMVTWDLLGARVAPDGIGGNVFEGGLYLYPATAKDQVVGYFRRLYRRHHRRFPLEDLGTFFRKHGMVFHHLWLNLVAFPEPPHVVTSDGDPLIFCRSVFDCDEVGEVKSLLEVQPGLHAIEGGRLVWREAVDGGAQCVLGTWAIEGKRIVFETTSQERAARGRTWLEGVAGDRVRYRATALETLEQAMGELRRPRAKRPDGLEEHLPAAAETGVRELFDRHYRSWLDRPVPALGNRTPRAAARTRLWRVKLVDLLKQFENSAQRGALQGRPSYDFSWIWRELGLDRSRST